MITIQDCDHVMNEFNKYKEIAGQHQFVQIFRCDMLLSPAIRDLHVNWDDHHAELFMKYMKIVFNTFGIMTTNEAMKKLEV